MTFSTPKANAELTLDFIDVPEHLSKLVFYKDDQIEQQTCNEIGFTFYRTRPIPSGLQEIAAPGTSTTINRSWINVISPDTSSNGSITVDKDTCERTISGPNYEGSDRETFNPDLSRLTYVKIQAPSDGTLTVDYQWSCDDPSDQSYDWPWYSVDNNEPTAITNGDLGVAPSGIAIKRATSNPQAGTYVINFLKDQWVSIGVISIDRIAGPGTLILSNPQNVDSNISLCGMTSVELIPGCGTSQVFPVDITDVIINRPKSSNANSQSAVDSQNAASLGLSNNTVRTKEESIQRVAKRLVDAINSNTLLKITATLGKNGNRVIVKQQATGPESNTSVYALRYLGANGDDFGYSTQSEPRRVGLKSNSKYEELLFKYGSNASANFPFGVPYSTDNPYSQTRNIVRKMIASPNAGTVTVTAAGSGDLINALSDQHPYSRYTPYDESNAQVSFGFESGSPLYGTQTGLDSDFLMRGSTQGPLDEPLRNKDQIVIDLSPVEDTNLAQTYLSNYPMAYYNFAEKKWDRIGFGTSVSGATTLKQILDRCYIGFSQGWSNVITSSDTVDVEIVDPQLKSSYTGKKNVFQETGWFSPIDTFGFPLHPKYHAVDPQCLEVSQIVDRPFLIEKIVYEFSASMPNLLSSINDLGAPLGKEYRGSGGSFFILNQRKANPDPGQESSYTNVYVSETSTNEYRTPQDGGTEGEGEDFWKLSYDNGGIPRKMYLSPTSPITYVDTVRDLVTFARIGTVWPTYDEEIEELIEPNFPHPASFMDLAIEVPATGTFNGSYTLAAPVRAPSQNSALGNIILKTAFSPVSPGNIISIYASRDSSTRNALDIASGRSQRAEFFGPETSYRANGYNIDQKIFAPKTDNVPSPYLIIPGDKLIFGWQSPISWRLEAIPPTLSIQSGKGKLILYGSYLQDDKPVHNIFKESLTSDALHESIPSGPWVLDRFESEPQMMYSSSMREEHITGTMVTRGVGSTLSVTNVNDLSIGGVRAVSARVSDGDVKQRWSFFRNNRLFDSNEQYYDSMLPDPATMLVGNARLFVNPFGGSINDALLFIGQNGRLIYTNYPTNPTSQLEEFIYESSTNREFLSDSFLLKRYSSLPRVKRVNSKSLRGKRFPALSYFIVPFATPPALLGEIRFITGTISGSNNSRIGNDFSNAGGLLKDGIPNEKAFFSPISSMFDTNPIKGTTVNIVDQDTSDDVNYGLSRFIGCFGDGFAGLVQFTNRSSIGDTGDYLSQMIYRGVKHGLINPTPLFSNAIFNGTRFGQPRDMMEQRQYTRFSLADNTLTSAAVEVVFINRNAAPGTVNVTSGSATNSSNVSKYATSEHPYDDALSDYGQIWDRDTVLPETLISI